VGVDPKTRDIAVDQRFYTWAAIAASAIVFTGFARTYYLKDAFGAPGLSVLVHVHGIVMTLWFILLLVQVRLVAMRRVDLHRRLGVIGALLAGLVLVVGVTTAITGAKRGATPGPPPLVFLSIPLGDMLVFAGLVAAGLLLRGQSDIHRRLMLLSSVGILTPAIARIPLEFIRTGGPLVYFGLTDLCVLSCVAFDTLKNRRLHPAFGWGTVFIFASQPSRLVLAGTSAWMKFATWLVA
jgi:uncharacterized membrane protein YozB (DUF420 family)